MDGFLVIGRCAFSDRPLRLCATEAEADQFALSVRAGGLEEHPRDRMKRGSLGPASLDDRLLFAGVIPFVGGAPGELRPVVGKEGKRE